MKRIQIKENGLYLVFEISDEEEIKLLHFSVLPLDETTLTSEWGTKWFYPAEVMVSGLDRPQERHGTKYVCTAPGYRLKFVNMKDYRNECGRKLEIITVDAPTQLLVTIHYQFYDGIAMMQSYVELCNEGEENLGVEYVSSFALTGIEKEGPSDADEKLELILAHNGWQKELLFSRHTLADFGMSTSQPKEIRRSSQTIGIGNTGSWSAKHFLPMGCLKNKDTDTMLFWQIEHNGSWYWEISDQGGYLYLQLAGPTEQQAHWWKNLAPGERFVSVPASIGCVHGDLEEAAGELTKYRRRIRRKNADNDAMPVIFNDYMNCLWGDPTTEKEIPLINAAHDAGCEYYCIDCGWYSDGPWWDGVGEWLPSKERFPGGLKKLTDYIREKGMIPGVWLELEVMGINCPKADTVPDDWYFMRHGKRVYDRSRYQLDFRNPQVIAHANEVIDRLVQEYGIGYIKMDYNIEPGIGTEINADSFGDGLLGHNRAYLAWLDSIFEKYPKLVIENCSSGGLRMDYAMLSRYSIQSTSDQEDYRRYATIAANAPLALTPEQAAVWSYPLTDGDREEVIFNMVNAMLLRIHQSGHLANLSEERFALVKEAISTYKEIRGEIRTALPFWPLGLSGYRDNWVCMGMRTQKQEYLAVWRRNSKNPRLSLNFKHRRGWNVTIECVYPKEETLHCEWNAYQSELIIELESPVSARLLRLTWEKEKRNTAKRK